MKYAIQATFPRHGGRPVSYAVDIASEYFSERWGSLEQARLFRDTSQALLALAGFGGGKNIGTSLKLAIVKVEERIGQEVRAELDMDFYPCQYAIKFHGMSEELSPVCEGGDRYVVRQGIGGCVIHPNTRNLNLATLWPSRSAALKEALLATNTSEIVRARIKGSEPEIVPVRVTKKPGCRVVVD